MRQRHRERERAREIDRHGERGLLDVDILFLSFNVVPGGVRSRHTACLMLLLLFGREEHNAGERCEKRRLPRKRRM